MGWCCIHDVLPQPVQGHVLHSVAFLPACLWLVAYSPTEDASDDDGPMRDAGFRMSEATRRHMIEDLARGRSASMARALLGGASS